jgi:hypothetical protein
LEDFLDTSIHAFDHSIGLWMAWRDQAMHDAFLGTGLVEGGVSAGFPVGSDEDAIVEPILDLSFPDGRPVPGASI